MRIYYDNNGYDKWLSIFLMVSLHIGLVVLVAYTIYLWVDLKWAMTISSIYALLNFGVIRWKVEDRI